MFDDIGADRRHQDLIAEARRQFERVVHGLPTGGSSNATILDRSSARTVPPALPGYQILREVHRGGQGVVYEAVQQSTQRTVAVKVLREGPFAGEMDRLRFEREVSILAQLQHRNIIGILDRGSASGSHYLVMDFIEGRPLDRYAREHGLDLKTRLHLFAEVCDAVTAAHLRGVIHRDLKPGNILVDASGEPRILDFGLAKLSEIDMDSVHGATQTGQFIGSLPWASPEQARGLHGEVDIRSDVYSLGVILYQFLTDRLPYSTVGGIEQALAAIRGAEPVRPRSIAPEVDDDLETIVLKCLSKEPTRRYQSVGELARDVRHYLASEPIEARRESGWYVLRKLLSRHRAAAAVAATFVVIITAASVIALALWRTASVERDLAIASRRRADTEAAKATRVAQFAQGMLSGIDPATAGALDKLLMRKVLDDAAAKVESELAHEPEVQASVSMTIGKAYQAIGDYGNAGTHLKKALELRRNALGNNHAETLSAMDSLAMLYWENDQLVEAEEIGRAALMARGSLADADHPDRLMSMAILAEILDKQGRYDEAEPLARETLERRTRVLGPEHSETLSSINNLAGTLQRLGRLEEAEALFLKAVEAEKRTKGETDPHTLRTKGNLATLYLAMGRLPEAEASFSDVLTARRDVLGNDHPDTLNALGQLASVLRAQGNLTESEALARQAVDTARRTKGNRHPLLSSHLFNLGSTLRKKGDYAQAETAVREAVSIDEISPPSEPWRTDLHKLALGVCLGKQGRYLEAEQLLLLSQAALGGRPEVPDVTKLAALQYLSTLYEDWDAAEPNTGKAEQAAEWRGRLEIPTTQGQ